MPCTAPSTRPSTPPPWADCTIIETAHGQIWRRATKSGRWFAGSLAGRTADELERRFGPCTPLVGPGGIPVVRASTLSAILADTFALAPADTFDPGMYLHLEGAIRSHVYIAEDVPEDGPQS